MWASVGADSASPHVGIGGGVEGSAPGLGCAAIAGYGFAGVDEDEAYVADSIAVCPYRAPFLSMTLRQRFDYRARPGLFSSYRGPRAPVTIFGWGFDVTTWQAPGHEVLVWGVSTDGARVDGRDREALFTAEATAYRLSGAGLEVDAATVRVTGSEQQGDLMATRFVPAAARKAHRGWDLFAEVSIVHAGNWISDDEPMTLPTFTTPSYAASADRADLGFSASIRRELAPSPGNALVLEDRLDARETRRFGKFAATVRGYGARNHVWTARGDDMQFMTGGVGLDLELEVTPGVFVEAGGEYARSMYADLDGQQLAVPEVAGRLYVAIAARFGKVQHEYSARRRTR